MPAKNLACLFPVWAFIMVAISTIIIAAGPAEAQLLRNEISPDGQAFFRRQYLSLGASRNVPAASSRDNFTTGIPHPVLGYRYFLSDHWVVGVSGQFRFFREDSSQEDLVLATFSQDSLYSYRIGHHISMLLGGRLLYLSPVRKGMFPLQRHRGYSPEVGAAISAGILYRTGKNSYCELRLERWRGTRTMKLHGVELSLSMGYSLTSGRGASWKPDR